MPDNKIGPGVRTALDVDQPNPKGEGVTAFPKSDVDEIQKAGPGMALHLVGVPKPQQVGTAEDMGSDEYINNLQKKFEAGELTRVSPEEAGALFVTFPGLEKVPEEDKSNASGALNKFLDAYGVVSNVGTVRQAVAHGGGHPVNPVNIAVDAITKASQVAGTVVGSAIAGAAVGQNLVGAVKSAAHAIERSDVLDRKQRFLKMLGADSDYVAPTRISENGQLAMAINYPEENLLGVHEMLFEALSLAERNEQKRIARASANALGNTVGAVGGAMTIAGAAGAGIGAVPGLIVSGVGAGISLSTSAWQLFNYAVKRVTGTKGADREAAAKLIWGLALMHKDSKAADRYTAIDLRRHPMHISESPAKDALYLANGCQNATTGTRAEEQKNLARKTAAAYWEDLAKRWENDTGEKLSIDSPRAGQAIFTDLGSVPSS